MIVFLMIFRMWIMEKFKNFMGKYGFFIASACFFISYILDDMGNDSSNLIFAIAFFVFGLSRTRKNKK